MTVSEREFIEAIESFKVVDTCLKCFYEGYSHMYRPLSAQIRLLLCDSNRKKDNSLITRMFENIRFSPIIDAIYLEQGEFGEDQNWANNVRVVSNDPAVKFKVEAMPFEITQFANGLEIADLLIEEKAKPIPISDWLEQHISIYPVPITIRSLVKTVADLGGGAHVHHKEDKLLDSLSTFGPSKVGVDALFTIAIARIVQQLGWFIVQFFESHGTKGSLSDISINFDNTHQCVVNAAKVPEQFYQNQHTKYNLMSIGNV